MSHHNHYGFATRQIHVGKASDNNGALCAPIYQTSTFAFSSVEQGGHRFAGEENGYIYSRLGNPTQTMVEEKMASLENGEAGLATASGMGAIATALWSSLKSGDHLLADETLYGCTFALLTHGLTEFGVQVDMVDFSDIEAVRSSIRSNTKVVYFETPCNPNLKILDIQAIAEVAHGADHPIRVIVDNTFCSPYLQRPLDLGADAVVHSATKYLNGHGDVIAGIVVSDQEFITRCKMFGLKDMTGAVISPFDAFLLNRGLKTLDIRMERHCANAWALANFLKDHPAVKKVYYPGLPEFTGHDIAKKQMSKFGGMVSFELKVNRTETAKFLNNLELVTIAVSLGDAETLVEHPASMTHSTYTPEELAAAGIPEGLIRVSLGLENTEDIIAAFEKGLDQLK
jgi:methionine-gamma-lyase